METQKYSFAEWLIVRLAGLPAVLLLFAPEVLGEASGIDAGCATLGPVDPKTVPAEAGLNETRSVAVRFFQPTSCQSTSPDPTCIPPETERKAKLAAAGPPEA